MNGRQCNTTHPHPHWKQKFKKQTNKVQGTRIQPRDTFFVVVPSKRNGMVAFSFSFLILFSTLILLLHAQPSSSSTQSLTGNPSFDPDIDLFGDANVVGEQKSGPHVKLTRASPSSSGLLIRRSPVTFAGPTSLSTSFSFSISPDAGNGVVLVLVPGERDFSSKFPGNYSFGVFVDENYVAVEFDTSKDDDVNDVNANHVGIDVGSLVSVAVANVSSLNLVLNSGEKLNAWVDYEAGSKTLQVRLSKEGESRPKSAIVSHGIDLFKIWGDQNVFLGISSSNNVGSKQVVSVYSWKVSLRNVSKALHSGLVDTDKKANQKGSLCTLRVLAGLIFGTGCIALVMYVMLFMWVIFFQRHEEESLAKIPDHHPASDVRYERIDVAVDKNNAEEDDEN
ncbi:hypothetical protein RIF29_04279 [Crotalaria pallida]|uniref:Legume lectin domain-containing protein n=1 Tax=Crotalaria pallida TaxID=3830 RepID=A0AAN9J1L3_CROPI